MQIKVMNIQNTNNGHFFLEYAQIVLSKEEIIAAIHSISPITELKSEMNAMSNAKPRRIIGRADNRTAD